MEPLKSDPHSIFKTFEDYVSWVRYEEQAELIEGLTDDERRDVKNSIRNLRGLLGEEFLQRSVKGGNPVFFWYVRNAVPHAKRALIRLAERLKSFEEADGFSGVVRRLKDARKTAEVLTVLSAASKFRDAEFIVSFDPEVKQSRKVPDLRLVNPENGEEIYVEVSRLMVGAEQQHNSSVYFTIFNHVHDAILSSPGRADITKPRVQPYVRILRSIRSGRLPKVIQEIRETIYSTAVDNKYRERSISNEIEMAVSPASDHSEANAWASERGMTDLVEAPEIILGKELRRAKDKINRELKQLPPDKPGIIAIPTENLLFLAFHPYDIIMEVAEKAKRYSNLLCAALFHTMMKGPQESSIATLGDHAFVTRMNDLSTERTAFVMNENFSLPLATSTIEKVRRAFLLVPPF